jgi:hypothetical protein
MAEPSHRAALYTPKGGWARSTTLGLALVALAFSHCSSLPHDAGLPLTTLSDSRSGLDPLRNAFNRDVGKVRLILLLDPT